MTNAMNNLNIVVYIASSSLETVGETGISGLTLVV